MTAPALPGAAPDPAPGRNDPARLPPEVERALMAFARTTTLTPESVEAVAALRAAIMDAMRAASVASGAASPAAGASARALGGDGEPVAWAMCHVPFGHDDTAAKPKLLFDTKDRAEDVARRQSAFGVGTGARFIVRPMTWADAPSRRAATGAEVERAVAEEREAIAAWHDAEADRIRQEIATSLQIMRENASAFVGLNTSMDHEYAQAETHRECAAAIRARGVKS